jgi:hypothetical protein
MENFTHNLTVTSSGGKGGRGLHLDIQLHQGLE